MTWRHSGWRVQEVHLICQDGRLTTRELGYTLTCAARLLIEIDPAAGSRVALEAKYGRVWTTAEMQADFQVLGFMEPLVAVRRKSDGQLGSLSFQHNPRFYFDLVAD